MEDRERRKTLVFGTARRAERYFILLEFILLMFTMIYLLYLIFGTVGEVTGRITIPERKALAAVFDQINFLLLVRISILFLVVFLVNILLGLFYLHRLIGPLTRIRVVLAQIAEGIIPDRDVTLRKGDFPTDLAEALSQALKRIREYRSSR